MTNSVFDNIEYVESLRKFRLSFISSAICSPLFYYLMTSLNSSYQDFIPGRVAISILSLIGLIATFSLEKNKVKYAHLILCFVTVSFIVLYMYLLHINNWSVFFCWSYFVCAAIICSITMTWNAYLLHSVIGVGGPLILGFWSPMSTLALFHFHSANIASFLLIGVSVHSIFKYKKEVAKLTNDLIQQSKMAALGEMAGGISHEINNPLAIIKASVEQLKRVAPESLESKDKFDNLNEKINRMVDRITTIIAGLREFSQENDNHELELHDLNEVINLGIQLSMSKFNNLETEIKFTPAKDPAWCLCKKNQIIQVIMNLCSNALEATERTDQPLVEISLEKSKQYYTITIVDNGLGVLEEHASKVMEPFFTTKEIGKGLGLGLSAAHGFAKVHGGELNLERTKEKTRFVLKLPVPNSNSTLQ